MNRFLLFSGQMFYANGGMSEFVTSNNSLELLIQCGECMLERVDNIKLSHYGCREDWYHIFDTDNMAIIKSVGKSIDGILENGDL